MKFNKFIYILPLLLFSFNVGNIYASSDISAVLFAENAYNTNNILNMEPEVIVDISYTLHASTQINSDTKSEIDAIVNKALEKARQEEEAKYALRQAELKSNSSITGVSEAKTSYNKIEVYDHSSSDITAFANTMLDVPYVYGGTGVKGFDCSGFVKHVFSKFDINLPRTTYQQIKQGTSIPIENIKENDLIFFDTRAKEKLTKNSANMESDYKDIIINEKDVSLSVKLYPTEPTHVGIYIGEGKFIHASSSKKKVVVDYIDSSYFKDRIVDIKRYI